MRRWTVLMAAALLTVFVGCGTASVDEKVNIQTELTPAAGEMPAAEFLPPQNEGLADGTEAGIPAGVVSAGDGAESEDVSVADMGAADVSEGVGMAGVGAPGASSGAGTVGDGTSGEGAPGVSAGAGRVVDDAAGDGTLGGGASGAAGDGMTDINAGAPGYGAAGDGMTDIDAGAQGDGTAGEGATGASEGTPGADTTENSGNTDGASSLDLSVMAGQVFALINAQRSGAGIATLEWEENLAAAAQTRAGELAVSFSHTRPDGSRGADITGITPCGENLASTKGSLSTAENVVGKWTKSGAHSENILCADYTKAGVALYQASNGTVYWVVLFTGE